MNTSNSRLLDGLAAAALGAAFKGAQDYLAKHKLFADQDALAACVRSWVAIKMQEALRDAREAIDANMHVIACHTFAATMVLAGIEAAREASVAPRPQPKEVR